MDSSTTIQRVKLLLSKQAQNELTTDEADELIALLSIVDESIIDLTDINSNQWQDDSPNNQLLNAILIETEKQGLSDLLTHQAKHQLNTSSQQSLEDIITTIRTRKLLYDKLSLNAQRYAAHQAKKSLGDRPTAQDIALAAATTVSATLEPATTGGDTDKFTSTHSGKTPQQVISESKEALVTQLAAAYAHHYNVINSPELQQEIAHLVSVTNLTDTKEQAALFATLHHPPTAAEALEYAQKAQEINPSDYQLNRDAYDNLSYKSLPLAHEDPNRTINAEVVAEVRNLDKLSRNLTDAEQTLTLPHHQAIALVLDRRYDFTPQHLSRMTEVVISASGSPATPMNFTPGSSFNQEIDRGVHDQVDRHVVHPGIGDIARHILKDNKVKQLPHVSDIEKSAKFTELSKQFPNLSRQLSQNWERLSQLGYISPTGHISSAGFRRIANFLNPTGAISSRVQSYLGQQAGKALLKLSERVASESIKKFLQTVATQGLKRALQGVAQLANVAPGLGIAIAIGIEVGSRLAGKLMQPINALFGNKKTSETIKDIGRGALGGTLLLASLPMVLATTALPILISPVIVGAIVAGYLLFFIPVINMGTIISTLSQLESNIAGISGRSSPYTGPKIDGCAPVLPTNHGFVYQGPYAPYSHSRISAVDIYQLVGNPVYSVSSGTVTAASYYGVYGNRIIIRSQAPTGTTYSVTYAHLSVFQVGIGETVSPGQQIALSGATSSNPEYVRPGNTHLHLEYTGLDYNACPPGGRQVPRGCTDQDSCNVEW